MNNSDLKLGWILALLEIGDDNDYPSLSESESSQVELMRKRITNISSEDEAKYISDNIPNTTCPMENPFFSGNEDLFLDLFLNHHRDPVCHRLTSHLNSCFACFEIFTQVLRDYYHKMEELVNKTIE
jgi:hypothetical protein